MIVENHQSFSPRLTRSDLFTRPVQGLCIQDTLRQAVARLRHNEDLTSRTIWIGIEGVSGHKLRLILKRQPCRFGGYRWWAACPRCQRYAAVLYFVDGRVACRICHRLKYMSHVCSNAPRLMHHYARLREALEHRPGPKSRRYWTYLAKEDFNVRRVTEGLQKWGQTMSRQRTA